MTGITRQQAAQALAEYFGTTPVHYGGGYDTWIVTDPEGKEWKLMSDGSIQPERKTSSGYEKTSNRQYNGDAKTDLYRASKVSGMRPAGT